MQAHEMRKEVEAAWCWQKEEGEEAGRPAGGPWMGGCQGEQVVGGPLLDWELGEEEGGWNEAPKVGLQDWRRDVRLEQAEAPFVAQKGSEGAGWV